MKNVSGYANLLWEVQEQGKESNAILLISTNDEKLRKVHLAILFKDENNLFENEEDKNAFKNNFIDSFMNVMLPSNREEHEQLTSVLRKKGIGVFLFQLSFTYFIYPYSEGVDNEITDEINEYINPIRSNMKKINVIMSKDNLTPQQKEGLLKVFLR